MVTAAINEDNITHLVLAEMENTPNERTRALMQALIRHLHAFIREVEPTDAEWSAGIDFLTATGQMCNAVRQEFILLSDALGVTTLKDAINHRQPSTVTPHSLLGPFFLADRPWVTSGADISGEMPGHPLYFAGRILDAEGVPIPDATVDVWHADGDGFYDVTHPGYRPGKTAMRACLRTDAQGGFALRSVLPAPYPLPAGGPVAEMMQATARSTIRPAHVHIAASAPGYASLTTMLFVAGDAHLGKDPVFGVREGLVHPFQAHEAGQMPDGRVSEVTYYTVQRDFHLAKSGHV